MEGWAGGILGGLTDQCCSVFVGATKLSNVNILYIVMSAVIVMLIIVLATICACIRMSVAKSRTRRNSSRKTSSRPSDSQLPMDPELICHDRLSKAPMLPSSHSTNSSSFNPYDSTSDHQTAHRFTTQNSIQKSYEPIMFAPSLYATSSKYSYSTAMQHSPSHQIDDSHKFSLPHQNQYDTGSCLTSL